MNNPALCPRHIESRLADTPVVLLAGPRQAGKTTLARQVAAGGLMRYLSLDGQATLLSAREDSVGLVRSLNRAVIDEIQRAPQLLLAIKRSVDEDRRPGRFLLTGSAQLMSLPTVPDSLAGRMETRFMKLNSSVPYAVTDGGLHGMGDAIQRSSCSASERRRSPIAEGRSKGRSRSAARQLPWRVGLHKGLRIPVQSPPQLPENMCHELCLNFGSATVGTEHLMALCT